jgi:hypothetical protein
VNVEEEFRAGVPIRKVAEMHLIEDNIRGMLDPPEMH